MRLLGILAVQAAIFTVFFGSIYATLTRVVTFAPRPAFDEGLVALSVVVPIVVLALVFSFDKIKL